MFFWIEPTNLSLFGALAIHSKNTFLRKCDDPYICAYLTLHKVEVFTITYNETSNNWDNYHLMINANFNGVNPLINSQYIITLEWSM